MQTNNTETYKDHFRFDFQNVITISSFLTDKDNTNNFMSFAREGNKNLHLKVLRGVYNAVVNRIEHLIQDPNQIILMIWISMIFYSGIMIMQ